MPDTPQAPFWARLFGAAADEVASLRAELERVSRLATELTGRCAALEQQREQDARAIEDLRSVLSALSDKVEAEGAERQRTNAALRDLEQKADTAAVADDVASLRSRVSALKAELEWERADRGKTIEALIERIELHPGLTLNRVRARS
jgi:chromosome segregation ATPase